VAEGSKGTLYGVRDVSNNLGIQKEDADIFLNRWWLYLRSELAVIGLHTGDYPVRPGVHSTEVAIVLYKPLLPIVTLFISFALSSFQ